MQNTMRRVSTALSGGALALGALAVAPSAHAATTTTTVAEATTAAQWLTGTIGEDGLLPGTASSAFAYGANLDFGISLALLGQQSSPALAALKPGVDATISSNYVLDAADPKNAGAVAKAAYYYSVTGGDAADAGTEHLDLVAALKADVDDTTGQLGSSDNVYNQVWAVLALEALGDDEADAARDFLLSERGPGAHDVWGYDAGTWTNDPDATSYAVLALAPWSGQTAVKQAIDAGVSYLTSSAVQTADGGIDLGWGSGPNANSTGLAAVALGAAGDVAGAAKAAGWLAAHQIVSLPACGATSNAGAVAYDDSARSTGVSTGTLAQFASATAQALAGLAYLPASKPTVGVPSGFVPAGGTISVRITGLRAGQPACLSGGAAPVKVAGPAVVAVKLPAGTARRSIQLSTVGTTTSATVVALGAARPAIKLAKSRLSRGKTLKVSVSHLAAGERVTLKVGKKTVRTGTASTAGRFVARVKLSKKLVKKAGKVRVTVVGQFANRTNAKMLKVVR